MSDFGDIIVGVLEAPSPPCLPPLPQLPPPPPPPPAPSAPAPLGRPSSPSRRSPVASSGDIWDVPSSDEELLEEDGDAPASGLGYVIQYTNAVFND